MINYLLVWSLHVLAGLYVSLILCLPVSGRTQGPEVMLGPLDGVLLGKWTYRSFRNNPTAGTPVEDLLFGEGVLSIDSVQNGLITGTFDFGPGYEMEFNGTISFGNPPTLQFQGRGTGEINKDWLYDYTAYLGYRWPQGVDQKPSLVGTTVRSRPHSSGQAPAGVTASWIAVKQEPSLSATRLPRMTEAAAPAGASMLPPKRNLSKLRQLYIQAEQEKASVPANTPDPPRLLNETKQIPSPKFQASTVKPSLLVDQPLAVRQPSLKPFTLESKDGRLDVDLTVDYNKQAITIGKDEVRLRTYNGRLVGPVLRLKAGDTLAITIRNNLPPGPSVPHPINGHHEWNVTNLHFHGLHVAPQGTSELESDNVLISIPPGQLQKYEVHIPKDHVAGTFWYHAHRHGSTAAQVSSGMAGALVIDRTDDQLNLDSIPEVAAAAQEIMVLQAIPYQKGGEKPGAIELFEQDGGSSGDIMFGPQQWYKLGRYITVNGEKIPTITLAPGEVRRLRMIATGQRESMVLRIGRDGDGNGIGNDTIKFYEIAADGLPTGMLAERDQVELFPGYRSDVLIRPSASGTYYLVDMNTVKFAPGATGKDGSPERTSIIARIIVAGTPEDMRLPAPAELAKQTLPDLSEFPGMTTRYAFYGLVFPQDGVKFFVTDQNIPTGQIPAGSEFSPDRSRLLPLHQKERWLVGSRNGRTTPNGPLLNVTHPFHIHVNPFKVVKALDANGIDVLAREFGGPVWRDTLAMKQGYTYMLLTEYLDFAGSFVNHCHILDHEDNGMMEKVTIVEASPQPDSASLGVARGKRFALPTALRDLAGKPLLAVVIRSVDCGLCQQQIAAFEKASLEDEWPRGLQLAFIAPDTKQRVEQATREGLVKAARLISDPDSFVLGYIDSAAKGENRGHGILLIDANGNTIFKGTGVEPIPDVTSLQPHFVALATPATTAVPAGVPSARVTVNIWKTSTPTDDYVTWSPTPCTISLTAPEAQDVEVTLTNDPQGSVPSGRTMPLDGDAAFSAQLASGETAKETSLTLRLPKNGDAVPFYIAGRFPRASSSDKDSIIEVHEGLANGPIIGRQALMVRVRKDHRSLTQQERMRFLEALDYLHRTALAPDGATSMYMYFVRMHKAAAVGLDFDPNQPNPQYAWPDLAHKGPGFISWHRAFLLEFERALQVKFPDVTLPYWIMPEPSALFTQDFFGANPSTGTGQANADFSHNNPLFGWTADIDGVVDQQVQRHRYGRNPGDPNFGPFLRDDDLFKLDRYSLYPRRVDVNNLGNPANSFAAMLEMNPHNSGHNWIGQWMQNCQTSPRDPIFWVFHTGFDRQWAKWQMKKDRFNPDGSGDSFCPTGTHASPGPLCDPPTPPPLKDCNDLAPNGCVPVNHHLSDSLWPWNGKFGKAATVKACYPQEDMAKPFLKPFQAAPIPGLWPAVPQEVTNGDMIDFMGKNPGRLSMGFCYDDTPFDKSDFSPPSPPPISIPVLASSASPKGKLDVQGAATSVFVGAKLEQEQAVASLREIQESPQADVQSRRSALRILATSGETERTFRIVRSVEPKDQPLKAEALRLLSEFMMFSPEGPTIKEDVMTELEKGLASEDPEVRSVALWSLVSTPSPELVKALTEGIKQEPGANIPAHEAIQAAVAAGKQTDFAEQIRALLSNPDRKIQAAAAGALAGDEQSQPARAALASDVAAPVEVRSAALQSLRPDQGENISMLIRLVADITQDRRVRGEATAILGLWVRSSDVPLSAEQLEYIRAGLSQITDAASAGFDVALARAIRAVGERVSLVPNPPNE